MSRDQEALLDITEAIQLIHQYKTTAKSEFRITGKIRATCFLR
jgi:hypothetical protein